MTTRKSPTKKIIKSQIWTDGKQWTVQHGELKRSQGNPGKTQHLFKVVAEKIPFDSLSKVKKHMEKHMVDEKFPPQGIYVAHDSMGCPRYIGRGNVFQRLEARKNAQPLELEYFSFYVVSEKKHEREIETILIRAAGPLLEFNDRKKRVGIEPGSILDYEAGTYFFERQYKKGRKT
jgi:hypothetical protein